MNSGYRSVLPGSRGDAGYFVLSVGMVLLLDGALLKVFGGAVRPVPEIFSGMVSILGVTVTMQRLVLFSIAALITVMLYLALSRTKLGKAIRAVSMDHEAAMLQGVPYNRMALAGFLIAAGLAAFAGALVAPVTIVSPNIGADYLIKGFIAVIIGGLGSVSGAILGALFVAVVESIGSYFLDSSSATIGIFLLVIAVLLVRPRGLLGQ